MGRDPLECKHYHKEHIFEDHILMGPIYYGDRCKKCGKEFSTPPGPLDLGTYK